jgi:hypothetical protein
MAADLPNRETARDELLTLLQASIGTATVAAYYNYRVGDFAGQSPVVVVTSGPATRERMSYAGSLLNTTFEYDVHCFVLYVQGTAWAEADAEDRLDLIEKDIADCVQDNRSGTVWQLLNWAGASAIDSVVLGGEDYKHEVIRLSARI